MRINPKKFRINQQKFQKILKKAKRNLIKVAVKQKKHVIHVVKTVENGQKSQRLENPV